MIRPPFSHFPELSSPKVFLRELNESDLPFLLETMAWDGRTDHTREEAMALFERINEEYKKGLTLNWVLEDAETGKPVGTIGYYRGFANEQGEIGFVLLPAFHGKGYMSAALRLAIVYGQEKLKLKRIIAVTKPVNTPAIRLLESCGFAFERPFDAIYSLYEYIG